MDVSQVAPTAGLAKWLRSAPRRETLSLVAIAAIVVLALGLRLYGLDWDRGFDYTPHPDERAILMKVEEVSPPPLGDLGQLLDADRSSWNPRWFPYGSFPLYLLKGVQLISSLGPGDGLRDLRVPGRLISALADVATVAMIYLLGSRVFSRRVGLLAAALAALAVVHIQLSHFFAVDTLLALFAIVAMFFMYRVAREGCLRDSALAGLFIGLGLATKVSLAPIFGALVVAHLMYAFSAISSSAGAGRSFDRRWPAALCGLALAAATSLVVLLVVQPYTFLDWQHFYRDFVEQSEMVQRVRDYPYTRQYVNTPHYWYQLTQLATWGLGWPLGVIAWAGLLYVSLRGMRLLYGLAYLACGWVLPVLILLSFTGNLAIFLAAVIALLALVATLPLRSPGSRSDVLLLSWAVPSFLIIGALQVKFLRYLLPITPFLLLFGSRMLFAIWDRASASKLRGILRPAAAVGLSLLLAATGFYAFSYLSVYREVHPAVRASAWIRHNVPKGAIILKEHWEEGLPRLGEYQVRELPMYEDDTPQKLRLLSDALAQADYLVFFSNRLYGTIPRLPERYPATGTYYRLLFSGQLGYELVEFETSYPELAGVSFVDDTFRGGGLPSPGALSTFRPSPLTLDLGFADESYSVYDHPKVMVFRNAGGYDADDIRQAIERAAPPGLAPLASAQAQANGQMLSLADAEAQQRGGTWNDIIRAGSWTNRFPVLAWIILIEAISLLALPLTLLLFRPLADRGYLFAKALGLLAVCFVVWMLASLHWMSFSRGSIAFALLLLGAVSALALVWRRREIVAFVKQRWSLLLIGEVVFLAAFLAFVMLRMANPDLWHPYRGGEKPMDMAYLTAVLRSSYMPPYDPWFAGGYLNYYYWGQFVVATLIKATGIDPAVAFNLAIPLFFALTVAGAFALVYNLAEGTRQKLRGPNSCLGLAWSPVAAGIGAALFVAVLGNLDGAIQVGQGLWRALFLNSPFGQFDFWRSSRMMPPDPPGHEITEFPYFSFLFADLHAHLLVLPFTLLVLGLALSLLLSAAPGRGLRWTELVRLAVLGGAIGALRLINAWDFPTYLIVSIVVIFLAEYFAHGGLSLLVITSAGLKSAFVFAVGYLAFLPFHLNYRSSVNGLESTTNTTVLWQFLAITGLFTFIVLSYFVYELRGWLRETWRTALRNLVWLVSIVARADDGVAPAVPMVGGWLLLALLVGTLALGFALTAIFATGEVGSTIPFALVLLALVLLAARRWLHARPPDAPYLVYAGVIVGIALLLTVGLDLFRAEGDIDRMNSIFKFYLQIWVLFALASAYLLWRLLQGRRVALKNSSTGQKAWLGLLFILAISAAVYPVMGTRTRLGDRFSEQGIPLTLNGTAYIEGAVYQDQHGPIILAADFEGIKWLREHAEGSPVILEGFTPSYRWGGRVSVYTGMPAVIGWQWHQEQQRWDNRDAVNRRIEDVNRIYLTTDAREALDLLGKYNVSYIYVGQLERLYYPAAGLAKFEELLQGNLDRIWSNDQVVIYRVRDTG